MKRDQSLIIASGTLLLSMLALPGTSAFGKRPLPAPGMSIVQQNTKSVKVNIVDETGEPLIGATVYVGDKAVGITDLDGNITVEVPANGQIRIGYVGYQEKKVSVAGKSEIKVALQPDNKVLEDVVVIGYGVQKKSNVTGAIASVKSEDLANKVNSNAAASLQGKVSGVQVVNNSGAPGASPQIRVRGYSSNGSSEPLYVVDGLKVASIDFLDPSSIESIEVLKDAASAAIYGAEAGNGVVLITTKNGGHDGHSEINFDTELSWSTLAKKMKFMHAKEFIQYNKEADANFEGLLNKYYDGTTDTDWLDEMFKTGVMQKYNLNASGNNKNGSFFVSMGYMQNNGMLISKDDLYKRFTVQINGTYNIKPWLEVGTSNTLSYVKSGAIGESNATYGQIAQIYKMDPLTPVEYAGGLAGAPDYIQKAYANGEKPLQDPNTGNYYGVSWYNGGGEANPMGYLYRHDENDKAFGVNGMTYANFKPFKGFVFTTRLGYRFMNLTINRFDLGGFSEYGTSSDPKPYLSNLQHTQRYYQWENFFNYNLKTSFGEWGIMAGMSYSDRNTDQISVNTNELSGDAANFRYLDYSTSGADDHVGGYNDIKRQIAYYGRISWSYLDRYNVQFNFRADSYDAAYLDLNHNWGYFPSVSAGWLFTNEKFLKPIVSDKGFNYGKLRASWGKNGSISNLGNYMYASTLNAGATTAGYPMAIANNSYYTDGKLHTGVYPSEYLANPKLRWEESKQLDLGLDLRFLNSRLLFTTDYYNKITDGLLVQSVAPLMTGTSYQYQNLGKVRNTGFEFELEWRDRVNKDFSYSVKGNLATVSNKVTKYRGKGIRIAGAALPSMPTAATYFEEGYPVWYIRGYEFTGVDEKTGEAIYKDQDGDGNITDADRVNLGKAIPDFTYGITISLNYKNFDFSAYGAGAQGSQLLYGLANGTTQKPMFLYNGRWTESNHHASMPSALYQKDNKFYNSSAFVFNANYFKIKQIQLGYTLPKSVLKKVSLQSLRAFVSLDNFFTFTSYPGMDPEVRSSSASAMAVDFAGYPISKSVSVGLNLSF